MEDERRRHSRKPVMLEAELTVDGETTPVKCVDISLGGAQLLVKPPPAYGTELTVKIQVSAKVALTLPATARWSGPAMVGVQFGKLRARDAYELSELLKSLAIDD